MDLRNKIIWVDGLAALTVGFVVLLFYPMISGIYRVSEGVIIFIASANLLYGTYSFCLAMQKNKSIRSVQLLVIGNLLWSVVCVSLIFQHFIQQA